MAPMSGIKKKTGARHKKGKGRIVFTNGVFDLLHPGHIKLLQFAKSLGGKLVVGLNSDRSTALLKGPKRPIHSEQERKTALESLGFVDEVIVFDEMRTTSVIRSVRPQVVVKGAEYTPLSVRSADKIPSTIKVVTFPIVTDELGNKLSTTAIIEKMKKEATE